MVHRRHDIAVLLADLQNLFDLRRREIAETKPLEATDLVSLIHTFQSVLERRVEIRAMDVENIHLFALTGSELLETLLCRIDHRFSCRPRLAEPATNPFCVNSEPLLDCFGLAYGFL